MSFIDPFAAVPASPLAQPSNVCALLIKLQLQASAGHVRQYRRRADWFDVTPVFDRAQNAGTACRDLIVDDTKCNAACQPTAAALATGLTIIVCAWSGLAYPPSAATAIFTVSSFPCSPRSFVLQVYSTGRSISGGFLYVLMPAATGSALLVVLAVVFNNAFVGRQYPLHWRAWPARVDPS